MWASWPCSRSPLGRLPRRTPLPVGAGVVWLGLALIVIAVVAIDTSTPYPGTAALLPVTGSEPHVDPRAPQNLVPIGALERELRHRMGDPGLVYRALRHAVSERAAS